MWTNRKAPHLLEQTRCQRKYKHSIYGYIVAEMEKKHNEYEINHDR